MNLLTSGMENNKKLLVTMCKFYSGYSGVRGADSRINFRPAGLEIVPRIRYKNFHQPLPQPKNLSLKKQQTPRALLYFPPSPASNCYLCFLK